MFVWKSSLTHSLAPAAIVLLAPAAAYGTQYLTLQQAQQLCFPDASSFEASHVIFTPSHIQEIESESGLEVRTKGQQIWKVKSGEKLIGYFIVDYVLGKHLAIDYAVALTPEGRVKDVEILEYRESYGSEIRGKEWRSQFVGKDASSTLKLDDDISNIGGATLSCRHVTEGVKRVLATFHAVVR